MLDGKWSSMNLLWRYARASSSYECFILRAVRVSNKLLGQGYVKERLRSSLRKFYGRYGDLIKQYEVPLSRMLHDILDDDHLQWHPPLIGHYTNYYANRGRLLLRTPGPVPLWDLQVFWCWDQSLLTLSCLRTFKFRTSLGTSVFASWKPDAKWQHSSLRWRGKEIRLSAMSEAPIPTEN